MSAVFQNLTWFNVSSNQSSRPSPNQWQVIIINKYNGGFEEKNLFLILIWNCENWTSKNIQIIYQNQAVQPLQIFALLTTEPKPILVIDTHNINRRRKTKENMWLKPTS